MTYQDLRFKVKLKIGDKSSSLAHMHHAMVKAGSVLIGGSSRQDAPKPDATQVQSFAHLQQILSKNL
jgi:hypothetical protein